jgi:hypothetical protein
VLHRAERAPGNASVWAGHNLARTGPARAQAWALDLGLRTWPTICLELLGRVAFFFLLQISPNPKLQRGPTKPQAEATW